MPEMTISRFAQCADHARHGREQHAQQQNKSGGLGTDGQKRGRRRRRALINVRRPDLKRKRGDLEAKADQHQQHAEQEDFIVRQIAPRPCASSLKFSLPVVPQISAMPKTMNADDSAPRIRYFTPASSDTSRRAEN